MCEAIERQLQVAGVGGWVLRRDAGLRLQEALSMMMFGNGIWPSATTSKTSFDSC